MHGVGNLSKEFMTPAGPPQVPPRPLAVPALPAPIRPVILPNQQQAQAALNTAQARVIAQTRQSLRPIPVSAAMRAPQRVPQPPLAPQYVGPFYVVRPIASAFPQPPASRR